MELMLLSAEVPPRVEEGASDPVGSVLTASERVGEGVTVGALTESPQSSGDSGEDGASFWGPKSDPSSTT